MVVINSRKINGVIQRTWKAELIEQTDSLIILVGKFENTINHPAIGVIRRGTVSYEYFWLDCWYSVFRFHELDGSLRSFYCNINMPPKFENDVLDYIDLDVDLYVLNDLTYRILDEDEFEENARRYSYSYDLQKQVHSSLVRLISMVNNREFPFDYKP